MSDPRDQSPGSFGAENEPEVFIGEPQPYSGAQPGDGIDPQSVGDPLTGSRPDARPADRERRKSVLSIAAALVALALVAGGIGGYLVGRVSHDISVSGRVSYGCSLIENVQQDHAAPEDWGDLFEDEAWNNVSAASTLFGGYLPADGEEDQFYELGRQLLAALSQVDTEALTTAVDAAHRECENR